MNTFWRLFEVLQILGLLRKYHLIVKFKAGHISFENFDRSFLDSFQPRVCLRIWLTTDDPDELAFVAKKVEETAKDDRIIVVVCFENIESSPEWNAAVEVHLQAALVSAAAEARGAYRFFDLATFGRLSLLVDNADHAVTSERVLRDNVFTGLECGDLGPISLVPTAEEPIRYEVLLNAGDWIKDCAHNLGERLIRRLEVTI